MEMASWQDLSEFEMEHVEFFLDEKQGNTQKRYFIGVQKKSYFKNLHKIHRKTPAIGCRISNVLGNKLHSVPHFSLKITLKFSDWLD